MARNLDLSVLMPAFDAEDTLVSAVESVLSQTHGDLQLIVADDCSRVPAGDVLAGTGDKRLQVIRRARQGGTAAARNTALCAARGRVVAQLDADDLWEPDYAESVLPRFDDPRVGLVYADATILGHPDGRESYLGDLRLHPLDRFPGLASWNPIPAPTVAMRTDAVRRVGGYARWLRSTEDYHLYLRLAAAGWRFGFVPRRLARYRWPAGRSKSSRERWHRSWDLAMRASFALTHPRIPGAFRAVGDTVGRLARGDLDCRPRLVYVVGAYPQLSESFVLDELRELRRQGQDAPVLAMFEGDGALAGAPPASYIGGATRAQRARALGSLLASHPVRTAAAFALPSRRLGARPGELVGLAPVARSVLGVRHIHAHFATEPATEARRLAALTGASFSFTAHAYDIHLIQDRLDEKLRAASFVATPTEWNRRVLAARAGSSAGKLHRLPNGIDLELFRRRHAYDPGGPLVAIGRLVPKKGFDVLLNALALLGDDAPALLLVGDGPERDRLAGRAAGVGGRVRMLGARPHREIPALLEQASAFVLPCVALPNGDRDAAPTVLIEAMAMELPVVSTRLEGIDELIGPDRGLTVPQRDAAALATALRELFGADPRLRLEMGAAGRRYVEHEHDVRVTVGRLRRLFAEAGVL